MTKKEKSREASLRHYHRHRAERMELGRVWLSKNRFRHKLTNCANNCNRRALGAGIDGTVTSDDIEHVWKRDEMSCLCCGKRGLEGAELTIDHIIPLDLEWSN